MPRRSVLSSAERENLFKFPETEEELIPYYTLNGADLALIKQQRYRASGLNLVTAAIVVWNTVYLERSIAALKMSNSGVDDDLLQHLSPLGLEHISLTGDYHWPTNTELGKGEFRPLRA